MMNDLAKKKNVAAIIRRKEEDFTSINDSNCGSNSYGDWRSGHCHSGEANGSSILSRMEYERLESWRQRFPILLQ
jgi:hypothetical protein